MLLLLLALLAASAIATPQGPASRPALVTDSLARNEPLYYFGLGSNMLRSKIENRGPDGSHIELLDMQAAVVPNHRLAFNMRGFAPLEPGMGSLEPVEADSQAVLQYEKPECHGALVHLSSENYRKLMASEGISENSTQPGYEEVVVWCIPYNASLPAVQAVALRARPHMRLSQDPCPSARYMEILRSGAKELELHDSYQGFLNRHPVQQVPQWLKSLAVHNLIAMSTFSRWTKWRGWFQIQSMCLFRAYVPSHAPVWRQVLGNTATATLLVPGALDGFLLRAYFKARKQELPGFLHRMVTMLEGNKDSLGKASEEEDASEQRERQIND